MMSSNLIIFQISLVVLLMTTLTSTINIPQSTSLIPEISQSYHDEQNPATIFSNHHNLPVSSKHMIFTDDDDSLNDEKYNNDYSKTVWPQIFTKRYLNKAIRGGSIITGGDSRLWAIPYRFGKRAPMPYRFGKRSGVDFRL